MKSVRQILNESVSKIPEEHMRIFNDLKDVGTLPNRKSARPVLIHKGGRGHVYEFVNKNGNSIHTHTVHIIHNPESVERPFKGRVDYKKVNADDTDDRENKHLGFFSANKGGLV